jgi:hypothetical protein
VERIYRLDNPASRASFLGGRDILGLHLLSFQVGATVGERLPRSPGPCASGQYRPGVP